MVDTASDTTDTTAGTDDVVDDNQGSDAGEKIENHQRGSEDFPEMTIEDMAGMDDEAFAELSGKLDIAAYGPKEDEPEGDVESEQQQTTGSDESTNDGDEQDDTDAAEFELPEDIDRIFQPFSANGRDMSVRSTDEAIQLMQQGANYHKKMQALSPHLKRVKTLERNNIDDATLNYLIDLHNKEPGAINKLVKDAEIDPLDLGNDDDEGEEYRPGNYAISDEEMAVEDVIDEIKSTPTYDKTIDVIGKDWDATSRTAFIQEPNMIRMLNSHVASGIFDIVDTEMQRRRGLGQLTGINDVTAYQEIGKELNEQGAFNHLGSGEASSTTQTTSQPAQQTQTRSNQKAADETRNARRRAASPTRGTKANKQQQPSDFDPVNLSDEEFEKQFSRLIKSA